MSSRILVNIVKSTFKEILGSTKPRIYGKINGNYSITNYHNVSKKGDYEKEITDAYLYSPEDGFKKIPLANKTIIATKKEIVVKTTPKKYLREFYNDNTIFLVTITKQDGEVYACEIFGVEHENKTQLV